jgi:hypothetical protein
MNELAELALKNNFLYHLSIKLANTDEHFNKIRRKGDQVFEKIEKTIAFINKELDDYLLIKTYRGYPRIPNDIDILVRDYQGAVKKLKKKSFYKIHVHKKIAWAKAEYFDIDFVWQNPRTIDFSKNLKVKIPNREADFLMHLAHINFETLHITLPELLYLHNLSADLNWEVIYQQAEKYNWKKCLVSTVKMVKQLYQQAYVKKDQSIVRSFPITLPRLHIVRAWIEKGLWGYALKKANKAVKIFASKNAVDDYYMPAPESQLLKGVF